jgi:hypothetical protein
MTVKKWMQNRVAVAMFRLPIIHLLRVIALKEE